MQNGMFCCTAKSCDTSNTHDNLFVNMNQLLNFVSFSDTFLTWHFGGLFSLHARFPKVFWSLCDSAASIVLMKILDQPDVFCAHFFFKKVFSWSGAWFIKHSKFTWNWWTVSNLWCCSALCLFWTRGLLLLIFSHSSAPSDVLVTSSNDLARCSWEKLREPSFKVSNCMPRYDLELPSWLKLCLLSCSSCWTWSNVALLWATMIASSTHRTMMQLWWMKRQGSSSEGLKCGKCEPSFVGPSALCALTVAPNVPQLPATVHEAHQCWCWLSPLLIVIWLLFMDTEFLWAEKQDQKTPATNSLLVHQFLAKSHAQS